MFGRVEWYDADNQLHSVGTVDKAEHTAICRRLRRRGSTIRKATQISKLG